MNWLDLSAIRMRIQSHTVQSTSISLRRTIPQTLQPGYHLPQPPNGLKHNRLIIGMTGATGAIYGIRALQFLRTLGVETHLIMSK